MKVDIRAYQDADLSGIKLLAGQTVDDGTEFPFEILDDVLEYWFSKDAIVYAALIGEEVVGSYVIKPNFPGRCSHIANAGYMVARQWRNQQIGSMLCQHSIETATQLQYRAMQFNIVVAENEPAIRLWQRFAFRKIGTVPAAFRMPDQRLVDVIIMHRELPSLETSQHD